MKKLMIMTMILLVFLTLGCAKTRVWTSAPPVSVSDSGTCRIRFEPMKKDYSFYVLFRLEIANQTNADMRIDWNKTKYLLNGGLNGGFVFEGMDPENIAKLSIPDDIVPAGGIFSKEIAPYKMLARAPLRTKDRKEGEKAINFGPLPAGENGIFLVVFQEGRQLREKLSVTIKVTEERR